MQQPNPALIRAHKILAGLMVGIVLVMAVLAGRFLFLAELVITTHGFIGNGLFVLAIANVVLVLVTKRSGVDFGVSVAIVALMFAQIGLGYVGRETADAAAWHIPNGVLLMALTSYQYATLRMQAAVAAATAG